MFFNLIGSNNFFKKKFLRQILVYFSLILPIFETFIFHLMNQSHFVVQKFSSCKLFYEYYNFIIFNFVNHFTLDSIRYFDQFILFIRLLSLLY